MADYLEELIQRISTRADLKGFDDLDRKQKRAIKANDILATSFKRAFGAFLGIQGIRSIIQTSRDFDLLQKSIKGLTGSTEDWEYLRSEADRTGTSLKLIAGAYKNFYSAANMSGFKKGSIQSMFSDVLTAGTGIGASKEQLHSALIALEQMLSKGKVTAQELRLQMGNALPGSFEIAAKAMGMTTQKLDEMMSKGQLMATTFLPKFTKELKNTYQQGFYQNVHSLNAELNRLSNAWQEFQANILQGEAGEALAQLVRDITKILKSKELLNFLKLVSKVLTLIIKNLKWILMFWGAKKILDIVRAVKKLDMVLLDLSMNTALAGTATQALAGGLLMIANGQILAGIKALGTAVKLLALPFIKLGFVIAGVVSWFMILQDLWLFFTDKDADTITGRLMKKQKEKPDLKTNPNMALTKEELEQVKQMQQRPDLYPQLQGLKFDSAGRPIIPRNEVFIPQTPYVNNGNNYEGYSENENNSSNKISNNITINISTSSDQPEVIASAAGETLTNILNNYNMAYGYA